MRTHRLPSSWTGRPAMSGRRVLIVWGRTSGSNFCQIEVSRRPLVFEGKHRLRLGFTREDQPMHKLTSYKRRVALVTGASSGLGRLAALHFGRHGARVGLVAPPGPDLYTVAAQSAGSG